MSVTVNSNVVSIDERRGTVERIVALPQVLAISGWRNSGKDTTADYLVSKYGFIKLSFASILKDMVSQMYSIPRSWMDDRDRKEMPLTEYPVITTDPFTALIHHQLSSELRSGYWTPRAILILEGSIKRSVHANYWVTRAVSTMTTGNRYVISDLRYRSEVDTLRTLIPSEQIAVLRLNRFASIDTQDPSERDLDEYSKFDAVIGPEIQGVPQLQAALDLILVNLGITPGSRVTT